MSRLLEECTIKRMKWWITTNYISFRRRLEIHCVIDPQIRATALLPVVFYNSYLEKYSNTKFPLISIHPCTILIVPFIFVYKNTLALYK